MSAKDLADARIDAGWIIPVEPAGTLAEHALIVRDGRILDLLPQPEADTRYAPARHTRLPGHVLIPGLVNLHTHAAMTLLRGYADDRPLMVWLREHIWPAENRWVSPEFVHDGTLLACAEMLRGGITCFNDMYFFPEAAVEAALQARMRIAAGIIVLDFPTPYAADPDGYLQKGMALRDACKEREGVSFCLAPHAPYTVGDRTFEKLLVYAEQLDLPVHIHVQETEDEIREGIANHGQRPLPRLRGLGLLGPNLIAVHAVHLEPEEIRLLAGHGCHVAHCPTSNLKLASGIAPVAALLEAGVNVGLGSDGAASNNRLDLFAEMRLAALLAKAATGRAEALPAGEALRMATLNGARALGLEQDLGSLAPGKRADVVAVDLGGIAIQPCYDPVSHLVYSAGREQVSHVWVAGEPVVEAGACRFVDEAELAHKAQSWRHRIAGG